MDFTIKEPQIDTYEYGDYLVAVQWKPQWLHFEATLYMKTRTGHIELGKFAGLSVSECRHLALNSLGGQIARTPQDEFNAG